MADSKVSLLPTYATSNLSIDYLPIVDTTNSTTKKITPANLFGITSNPVGLTDTQTLTNKILTAPTISSPVLSGTVTGTYTFAGTPTFPATIVTTTGSQTLTNKILTSPTINAPTVTNMSATQDTVVGFTTANSGTVYGIPITAAKLSGANLTNSTVGPSQLNTGAQGVLVATVETSASQTYLDLTTVTDTVTVTIGVNGLALVALQCQLQNNTAASQTWVSFAISGATAVAATDMYALMAIAYTTNAVNQLGGSFLVTGLASGSTTFKMKYRVSANTGTFSNRRIAVVPL